MQIGPRRNNWPVHTAQQVGAEQIMNTSLNFTSTFQHLANVYRVICFLDRVLGCPEFSLRLIQTITMKKKQIDLWSDMHRTR